MDARNDALRRAQEVRSSRRRFKVALRENPRSEARRLLAGTILEPEPWARTMRVAEALGALPRIGPVRVEQVMDRASAPADVTFGDLDARQRDGLLSWLTKLDQVDRARAMAS